MLRLIKLSLTIGILFSMPLFTTQGVAIAATGPADSDVAPTPPNVGTDDDAYTPPASINPSGPVLPTPPNPASAKPHKQLIRPTLAKPPKAAKMTPPAPARPTLPQSPTSVTVTPLTPRRPTLDTPPSVIPYEPLRVFQRPANAPPKWVPEGYVSP